MNYPLVNINLFFWASIMLDIVHFIMITFLNDMLSVHVLTYMDFHLDFFDPVHQFKVQMASIQKNKL